MLPIRRNRRVSTATVGVIGLAVLHLAAATGAAAPFGGHRRPRPEYVVLSAGDDRIRSASRVTAPGVGWTAERHPYLRNGTQQRIRLQGSSRSISSFARRDTAGSSRDFRKRKSRVALLLLLRGGSEGLKREAYDPRKAAEPSGSVRSSQGPLFPATPPKRHDDYKCGDADKAVSLTASTSTFYLVESNDVGGDVVVSLWRFERSVIRASHERSYASKGIGNTGALTITSKILLHIFSCGMATRSIRRSCRAMQT